MIIIALGNCPHPTDCSTPTSSHFPTPLYSINIFLSGGCLLIDRSAITIELNEANTQNEYIPLSSLEVFVGNDNKICFLAWC